MFTTPSNREVAPSDGNRCSGGSGNLAVWGRCGPEWGEPRKASKSGQVVGCADMQASTGVDRKPGPGCRTVPTGWTM